MSNEDKRYLGDVLINAENYERQKQFFRDIIESYQWKFGGNFDAATLQEMVPEDFATKEQGEKADLAILSPLLLGKTEITNLSDYQYIYTDAIRLDREDTGLDILEWYQDLGNDNLTEALIDIYNQVMDIRDALQNNIDEKLDVNTYNKFITDDYTPLKNSISGISETFTDENEDEVTKFNADLVNGLRFILITQDAYDALPSASKTYWRNVYIIKKPSEIPPDYADPMHLQLTDGYTFRVNNGYLQVSNGLTTEWKNICTLDELLSGANFDNIIQSFIEEGDYVIANESIINSILNISPTTVNDNWQSYPFLSSSLHDNFVEDILINNSSINVNTSLDNDGFKTVNLDLNTIIDNKLNPAVSNLNNIIDTEKAKITTAQQNISSIQTQIGTLNTSNTNHESSLNTIQNQLDNINNTLTSVNTNINNLSNAIGNWVTVNIPGLKYTSGSTTYQSYCMYNDKLKLAHVHLTFGMYIDKNDLGTERSVHKSKNTYESYYVYARPHGNTAFHPSAINPLDLVKIDHNGKLVVLTKRTSAPNKIVQIICSWTYKYWRKSDYY